MILAENIHYTYDDGTIALRGVDLKVGEGECVVLLGPNGSGKTTLLLILGCLYVAQKGRLRINGIEVNKKSLERARRSVGMVFQNPDDQVISPTVYDDIAFGPRNLGFDENEVKRRVESILRVLDIKHLRNKNPDYLSGGQKRIVAIAGILAMDPKIVVMDEPTAGLDGKSFRAILRIINNLRGRKTLIIATHDLDFAEAVGDRFVYMYNGKVVGESDEINYTLAERLGVRCFLRGEIVISNDGSDAEFIFDEGEVEAAVLKALEGHRVLIKTNSPKLVERLRKFPVHLEVRI